MNVGFYCFPRISFQDEPWTSAFVVVAIIIAYFAVVVIADKDIQLCFSMKHR